MAELQNAWADYERRVINPKASAEQRSDMRDTFFAGAVVLLTIILDASDPEATAAALQAELVQFHDDLARRAHTTTAAREAVKS